MDKGELRWAPCCRPVTLRPLPFCDSQVKPLVSKFLHDKQLPYNEDSYLARFQLFLSHYEEFMVHAPSITELVGLQ